MTAADSFADRAARIEDSYRAGRITAHEAGVCRFELEQEQVAAARKAAATKLRPGARVRDAQGRLGTVHGSTDHCPTRDPRDWVWVEWDDDEVAEVHRDHLTLAAR